METRALCIAFFCAIDYCIGVALMIIAEDADDAGSDRTASFTS